MPRKGNFIVTEEASTVPLMQHTLGHLHCPACEAARISVVQALNASLPFEEAARLFIRLRSIDSVPGAIAARYVRQNTSEAYERQTRSLSLFFKGMTMGEIRWWHMRAYQEARVAGCEPFVRYKKPQDAKPRRVNGEWLPPKGKTGAPVKAAQINQELGFLKRLKRLALCWTEEDDRYYQDLQEDENDVPRALSPQEQTNWIDISRQQERWMIVHWYSILAFESCASTNELRGLPIGDISLPQRSIHIPWPAAKNKHRRRDIAIESADALWALETLMARAYDLGAREPLHYLFPFRDHRFKWYPERQAAQQFLKRPWEEVRAASGLKWFRPYDTRHTAITRLAENGVPIDIIMARAGHVQDRMRRHYTHITLQAQRRCLRPGPSSAYFGPQPTWGQQPWRRMG